MIESNDETLGSLDGAMGYDQRGRLDALYKDKAGRSYTVIAPFKLGQSSWVSWFVEISFTRDEST